jgi:hypothetical protein
MRLFLISKSVIINTTYLREIYFNSEKTTTEEFIDEFKNITCSLHKLLNNI